MSVQLFVERAADLSGFTQKRMAGKSLPFVPLELAHIYIKLDFEQRFEYAGTADDAKGFLRSVARAAMATQEVALRHEAVLLEVQGSMIHVGVPRLPGRSDELQRANAVVTDLHWVLRETLGEATSRVEGWRMTVDAGKTLVVAGRGVHGDDSWVSLGKAANRPAKYLHEQLELSEDRRVLKRFWVAVRNPLNNQWVHSNLDRSTTLLNESKSIAGAIRGAEPKLSFNYLTAGAGTTLGRVLPVSPAGMPNAPTADKPQTYFGWVMRADLDGFTARVESCFDNDQRLLELAEAFYGIMDAAARFTDIHRETLAQLPWAGDNFTAAAMFASKDEYDRAIPKRLVELSLDFEKEMAEAAIDSGFGGWAQGVAGGLVHGNSGGNVYLGSVEVMGRRFLVGAGEGFGRSAQAFGDINPKAKEIVVFQQDWTRLVDSYKRAFEPAVTRRNEQSALFRIARYDALIRIRAREASVGLSTPVTLPHQQTREVSPKPYS